MPASCANEARVILGWDVGGTKSGVVLGTSEGELLESHAWPSETERGPAAMRRDFLDHARPLLDGHPEVGAVGVSIGGPLNPLTGVIFSPPHLPGWDGVPLADELGRELGLPVVVEHDAAACLEAECLWGAAKSASHAAYLTCGTGLGAGIMIDNRILRGPNAETPEIGHVRLAPEGPVGFDKAGSVEGFCSGTGLSKLAPFMFPDHFKGPTSPKRLVELAKGGDEHARAVIDECGRRTGQVCAMLADLFSPQVIILGSLARYLGESWQDRIREEFEREGLESNRRHTRIVPAALGDRLQPLSAIAPVVFR